MLQATAHVLLIVLVSVVFYGHSGSPVVQAMNEDLANSLNERGMDFASLLQVNKAIEAYNRAIDLNPFVAEYHFNLALLYHNCPEAAARLTGMSQEQLYDSMLDESLTARLLAPADREFARTYAWNCLAYEGLGATPNWDRALNAWRYLSRFYDEAFANNPNHTNSEARVHILLQVARIQLEMNRKEEARTLIDEALYIFPQSRLGHLLLDRC